MTTPSTNKAAKVTQGTKKSGKGIAVRARQDACSVQEIRRKLGLTRKTFSRLTGYSERAIATWESGGKPDEPGLRRIRETQRFQERLADVVQAEEIPAWLDTPNDAFD